MSQIPLSAALPARSRFLRLIVDHNPFYLLSAMCMLFGCLTLTNSLSFSPIPRVRLLGLVATLNCYELLLVGLAVWLIRSRNQLRDGAFLLGIEALFMADVAMLNAELYTIDQKLGSIVNGLTLLLAAVKLAVIFRALKIQSSASYALVLVHVALLLVLPGVFKHAAQAHHGQLAPAVLYGAWWAVGMLPVLTSLVFRAPASFDSMDLRPRRFAGIVALFVWSAFGSMLLHLGLTNWVYQVRWEWANLGPVLLGTTLAVGFRPHHVHTLAAQMRVQLALPVLAVALSMRFTPALVGSVMSFGITPMRLAMLGAMLVYLQGWWIHRHVYFAVAGALCVMSVAIGPTPGLARDHLFTGWTWANNTLQRLIPRTTTDWGVLAVISSFVLLVLGAWVSVIKGKVPEGSER